MNKFIVITLLLNSLMLGGLTVLHNPLAKIAENLSNKYQTREKALVCSEVLAKKAVYLEYSRNIFISGCLWKTKEAIGSRLKTDEQRAELDKIFKDQSSLEFDKVSVTCQRGASDFEKQGQISDRITGSLFYDLGCDKLGTTVEDAIFNIQKIAYEVSKEKEGKDE